MSKYFPRQFRATLSDVPLRSKLKFAPSEAPDESLGELLESFELQYHGLENLRQLFEVRDHNGVVLEANEYSNAFSGNRRELQQLCSALSGLRQKHSSSAAALALILQHGIASASTTLPNAVKNSFGVTTTPTDQSVTVDATRLGFGKFLGRGFLVFNPARAALREASPKLPIFLRRMDQFYTVLENEAVLDSQSNAEQSNQGSRREQFLPPIFTALIALAWEANEIEEAGEPLLEFESFVGDFVTPGLRNWAGTASTSREQSLPYLMVPDWEEFSDYYTYLYAWNKLVDDITSATRGTDFDRLACLEYAVLHHLRLICSVQNSKRLPTPVCELPLVENFESAEWTANFNKLAKATHDDIIATLGNERPRVDQNETRAMGFQNWVELALPLASSRNLCSERLTTVLRVCYEDLNLDDNKKGSIRRYLASALPTCLGEERAAADIDVLAWLDSSRADMLSNVRTAISERVLVQRRNFLEELRKVQVGEDILIALESEGADIQVLAALGATGIGGQSLSAIAEVFPAVKSDDSSSEIVV